MQSVLAVLWGFPLQTTCRGELSLWLHPRGGGVDADSLGLPGRN